MFIVNCSWTLRAGWTIVKGFLDEKTSNKIKIYDDNYLDSLLEYIDKENLPEFLGGTCTCKPHGCLMQPAGPWKEYYEKFPKETDEKDLKVPTPPQKWTGK